MCQVYWYPTNGFLEKAAILNFLKFTLSIYGVPRYQICNLKFFFP